MRSLLYLLPVLLIITCFNPLVNESGMTELFAIGGRSFTLEALLYGLVSGLTLLSVILWFSSYSDLMENGRFLAMLGRRLPVISMMISMIFRYIPDTVRHGREIEMSQRALLGSDDGYRKTTGQRQNQPERHRRRPALKSFRRRPRPRLPRAQNSSTSQYLLNVEMRRKITLSRIRSSGRF